MLKKWNEFKFYFDTMVVCNESCHAKRGKNTQNSTKTFKILLVSLYSLFVLCFEPFLLCQ